MFELTQILYYIGCTLGTLLIGSPAVLLLHRDGAKIFHPKSWFMGTTIIMLLCYWMSMFGIPMKQAWLIVAALSLIVWIIVWKRRLKGKDSLFVEKQTRGLLVLCFIAGSLALIPMIVFKACFLYGDMYTYVSIADYLLQHGYGSTVSLDPYSPWLSQVLLYQSHGFRMGAQFFLSFWTAALQQEFSVFVYSPASAFGISLYGMAVWEFTQSVWKLSPRRVAYAVIFSAFNIPFVIWSAVYGFFPQLLGLAFFIMALGTVVKLLVHHQKFSVLDYVEGSLWIASMAFCYSEVVPFFVVFTSVLYFTQNRSKKAFLQGFKSLALIAVFSLTVLGKYAIEMFGSIITMMGAAVGWEQRLNWIGYLACWFSSAPVQYNFVDAQYPLVPHTVFVTATIIMLALLVYGLCVHKSDSKTKHLTIGAILAIPLLLFLVYFGNIAENPFGNGYGNSWSVFKLAQYAFPVIGCFLFPYFADVFQGGGLIKRSLSIAFPSVFCVVGLMHAVLYSDSVTESMRKYTNYAENPIMAYIDIAKHYEGETRVLNLLGFDEHQSERKILTYFLRGNKLASDWSSDGYFSLYKNKDPEIVSDGLFLIYDPKATEPMLKLTEMTAENCVLMEENYGVGGTENSAENVSWTWNESESQYAVTNYSVKESVLLSAELANASAIPGASVDVYLNDQLIQTVELIPAQRIPFSANLKIPSGTTALVKFVYHGESVQEPGGQRTLNLGIWNIACTVS